MSGDESDDSGLWPEDDGDFRHLSRWRPLEVVLNVGGTEYICLVHDISPDGAALWTESSGEIDEGASVVLMFEGYGKVGGEVMRVSADSIGVSFTDSALDRRILASWLNRMRYARIDFEDVTKG